MSVYIIAEIGVNHNGNIDIAKQLIIEAKKAGADAVKFQTFQTEKLTVKGAPLADYQKGNAQNQNDLLKQLELSQNDFLLLERFCYKHEIDFLSTPFDQESASFLYRECKMKYFKIPSGELTNLPYLVQLGTYQTPLLLSIGMSNEDEIYEAIASLFYGYFCSEKPKSVQHILQFYETNKQNNPFPLTLLLCTTMYPTPLEHVHLSYLKRLQQLFPYNVGFSDHSLSTVVPAAAVVIGATVIEKHFTLNQGWKGPDHRASLSPKLFAEMVKHVRDIEVSLGSFERVKSDEEEANRNVVRKSLIAKKPIQAGEVFTEENIDCKRPGLGISPREYWNVLGTKATKSYERDDFIEG